MQVNEIKNEGLELHYQVTIPYGKFADTVSKKLEEIAKTVKMPGFRPGKVPLKLVEQKFKANATSDALESQVNENVRSILKNNTQKLATQPQIQDMKFQEGKDIEFKVILEKMPTINERDIDFSKITIENPSVKIIDKDIDEAVEGLFASKKSYKKAAKTYKAAEGDRVIIDFEGFLGDKPFEGGKGAQFPLVLGSKQFIPGFEDQLIGTKQDQEVDVKVKFPEEYGAKDLAGQDALFKVKVHAVEKPEKLEVSDELAKDFGAKDLSELREKMKNVMNSQYSPSSFTYKKMVLFNELEKLLKFEIPASLEKKELELLNKQIQQYKNDDPDLKNKSEQEIESYAQRVARRRVRIGLFLAEYAEKNDLKITGDDFKVAIMEQARAFPGSEKQIFDYYNKNPNALQSLSGPLIEDKSVKHILENKVKLKNKEYKREDFIKLIDDLEVI